MAPHKARTNPIPLMVSPPFGNGSNPKCRGKVACTRWASYQVTVDCQRGAGTTVKMFHVIGIASFGTLPFFRNTGMSVASRTTHRTVVT